MHRNFLTAMTKIVGVKYVDGKKTKEWQDRLVFRDLSIFVRRYAKAEDKSHAMYCSLNIHGFSNGELHLSKLGNEIFIEVLHKHYSIKTTNAIGSCDELTEDELVARLEEKIFTAWNILAAKSQEVGRKLAHCANNPRDLETFNKLNVRCRERVERMRADNLQCQYALKATVYKVEDSGQMVDITGEVNLRDGWSKNRPVRIYPLSASKRSDFDSLDSISRYCLNRSIQNLHSLLSVYEDWTVDLEWFRMKWDGENHKVVYQPIKKNYAYRTISRYQLDLIVNDKIARMHDQIGNILNTDGTICQM